MILVWAHTGVPRATAQRFAVMPKLKIASDHAIEGTLLHDNSWINPPSEVIDGGWAQILNYYEAVERSGETAVHRLKLVLVGAALAGKTTLARGLRCGEPCPTEESERTRGVDIHMEPWRPTPAQPLEVVMWDFGGQVAYHSMHQVRSF